MNPYNHVFVGWEERIISHEKGNRIVHYYLKELSGDLVLAVVGTERSIRHMIYIVAAEFLEAYGATGSINDLTKWRAKREVVEWLTSLTTKHRSTSAISNLHEATHSLGTGEFPLRFPRKTNVEKLDILWAGDTWKCCKQLKHYPAFCRSGTTIAVYSFVFIMAEKESQYLGYLEDLYEDKKGHKMVKVRWIHHNQAVKGVIPQLNAHPREVFITPHVQVISAECIDGPATILTPKHYEKCVAFFPQSLSSGFYVCLRQFKNNEVKPFSLSELRGYSNQTILSSLDGPLVSKGRKSIGEEEEDFAHEEFVRQGATRVGCCKGKQRHESGHSGVTNSVLKNQVVKCEPTNQKLKIKLSNKGPIGIELVGLDPQHQSAFNVDNNIELLCQDSGIRGCWFRCKVLQASQKRLRVQFYDVQDIDESGNLEEWVPASRVAAPDNLGMRCPGRLTIRPWSPVDTSDRTFEVGAAVDAWWCDGWWEGVLTEMSISGSDGLQVYLPGEDRVMTLQRKNIRISRDWVDNKWVDIKVKPDILSCMSSTSRGNMKLHMCSSLGEACGSDGHVLLGCKALGMSGVKAVEENKREIAGSACSGDLCSVKGLGLKKRLQSKR